jgi:hypothetical protein
MPRRAKKTDNRRLKVNYAEANRVRSMLLSEHVEMLNRRDVQTLVHILDDVYPVRRKSHSLMQPLLIGVGLGILLLISMTSL